MLLMRCIRFLFFDKLSILKPLLTKLYTCCLTSGSKQWTVQQRLTPTTNPSTRRWCSRRARPPRKSTLRSLTTTSTSLTKCSSCASPWIQRNRPRLETNLYVRSPSSTMTVRGRYYSGVCWLGNKSICQVIIVNDDGKGSVL